MTRRAKAKSGTATIVPDADIANPMQKRGVPAVLAGTWRIVAMETWDREYLDIGQPAQLLHVERRGKGSFAFGAVVGELDCCAAGVSAVRVEFSWQGHDESDEAGGRGFAELRNGRLQGRVYFHDGEDSWFVAEKQTARSSRGSRSVRQTS